MTRDNQELRDLILLATLPHVVFEGWSEAAMMAGVADLGGVEGIDDEAARRAFSGGMADMVGHFSDWADRRMTAETAKLDLPSMKVRERIAAALRCRFQVLAPYREAVRSAIGYLALPRHAALSISCAAATVDEIWHAIGDRSTDFSYYSKRAMLAPVLASSALYWLADEGDEEGDFPETWAFIDRRIADVLRLIEARIRLTEQLARAPSPWSACKRFADALNARRGPLGQA